MAKKSTPRKVKRNVPKGICHVLATFNNTIITVTDLNGDVLAWGPAGTSIHWCQRRPRRGRRPSDR